jgi:thioredoxin-like negative regulator of GroEL
LDDPRARGILAMGPCAALISLSRRLAGTFVLLATFAGPGPAAASWVRVRSPHFEVLSDAGEDRARAVAVRLEQFRRVVEEVIGPAEDDSHPATIVIAFRDEGSFAPFLPLYRGQRQDVAGYFQGGADRDYIAATIAGGEGDPHGTVFHEYAHVALNRKLQAQPLWLGEGLAEALSRWAAIGPEALVGMPAPDHLRSLAERKPMPLRRLLGIDYASPVYNEGDERAMFYSQSWALAHWVAFGRGERARPDLQAFMAAIAGGAPAEAAFTSAFGATVDVAEGLLARYVTAPLPIGRFAVPGLEAEIDVEAAVPPPAEVEYRLGDLLLHGGRFPEARRHLQRAVSDDPGYGPAHAALAHLALRQGAWEEARREVRMALAANPADAVALYRAAEMLVRETSARSEILSPEREDEVVSLLERAVALQPDLADACDLLARLRPEPYDTRIAQVTAALERDPARAELGLTLAGLYARKNDFASARMVLLRTRATARDDVHRFLSEHLLARLDGQIAGTAEVKGTLMGLECGPEGALRFLVGRGQERLRLEAPSATGIFLYRRDGTPLERTFTCGTQREAVVARYRPAPSGTSDGTLMSLTFQSP